MEHYNSKEIYGLVNDTRQELSDSILRVENKIDNLKVGCIAEIEKDIAKNRESIIQTRSELKPIRRFVVGIISIVLTSVLLSILYLIILQP